MQTLKKEIQESIVDIAARLFYNQGFEETSMRQIANEMQMSVSNLYKYFKNKEDLFNEIVKGYYIKYMAGFSKFISEEQYHEDNFNSESNSFLVHAIFESIKTDPIKFVLLMDKSKGTKYVGFKYEVLLLLEKHIMKGIQQHNKQEYIIKILVSNFFHGVVEIARNYQSDEWALKNIDLLVKYHMNGMHSLYKQ